KPVETQKSEPRPANAIPEPALRIAGDQDQGIHDVAFSLDNSTVAVQLGNWLVELWDLRSGKRLNENAFRGPKGADKPATIGYCLRYAGITLNDGTLYGIK